MNAPLEFAGITGISLKKGVLTAILILQIFSAPAETWRFALIGDVPYTPLERRELPKMLDHIAVQRASFIVHVGDIKRSRDRCDEALYEDRKRLFNASKIPLVLVPGDNEWTDCDRLSAGAYDPEERLAVLRRMFWSDDQSLGQKPLKLMQQDADNPEHARFRIGPVLFVTLNLPGSNNNFGMTEIPSREYLARDPKVLAWMQENYALAHKENLSAIVLLFQANPGFRHFAQGFTHRGYANFLNALKKEVERFPGKTIAVHGDTHWSRVDHPLRDASGKPIQKFTRVETHGYPTMGWTLGVIDSESPELLRFEAHAWPAGQKAY